MICDIHLYYRWAWEITSPMVTSIKSTHRTVILNNIMDELYIAPLDKYSSGRANRRKKGGLPGCYSNTPNATRHVSGSAVNRARLHPPVAHDLRLTISQGMFSQV